LFSDRENADLSRYMHDNGREPAATTSGNGQVPQMKTWNACFQRTSINGKNLKYLLTRPVVRVKIIYVIITYM
jgi:hypothetical protein